jgi:hypothetical protein
MSNFLSSPQRRKGRKEELFLLSAEKAESKTRAFSLGVLCVLNESRGAGRVSGDQQLLI